MHDVVEPTPQDPNEHVPSPIGQNRRVPTVPQVVARVLRERTPRLFALMGNGNAHLISELTTVGYPVVTVRHEAGTVAAADAHYRAGGGIAAATTTYGAGFTNTLTALAEASLARIPLVLVVGDAPSTGPRDFDVDQDGLAAAVGVSTITVTAEGTAAAVHTAFDDAARLSRPVILAVPYDLAEAPVLDHGAAARGEHSTAGRDDDDATVTGALGEAEGTGTVEIPQSVVEALRSARRPLLLAGRGVVESPGAPQALRALADQLDAFVCTSMMARNVVGPEGDLGVAGGFARLDRVEIMRQADVVLVLGASLNPFQMRYGTLFNPQATVLQVDVCPEARHGRTDHFLTADAAEVLGALAGQLPQRSADESPGWRSQQPIPPAPTLPADAGDGHTSDGRLDPRLVALALGEILPQDRTVVHDGGHFLGWAPMYWQVPDPHAHLLVGTAFQAIGLGFHSAVGAAAAQPERTAILVTGDGGGLMALADFESFVRTADSAVVLVFNDAAYGAELHQYAARGLDAEAMMIPEVDFAAIGRALGARGVNLRTLADLEPVRQWVQDGARGTLVVDAAVSRNVVAPYMQESMASAQPAPPVWAD